MQNIILLAVKHRNKGYKLLFIEDYLFDSDYQ